MDYRIKEVLRIMDELEQDMNRTSLPPLDKNAVAEGLDLSARTCKQQETVFATPWMKNALVYFGDVKQTKDANGEWHTEKLRTGADSKAVRWFNDVVHAALLKYNGAERTEYDPSLPPFDPQLYDTDCWLGWKKEIWDIQPGQAKQREEAFLKYGDIKTSYSYEEVLRWIKRDEAAQRSIQLFLEDWPRSKASKEVRNVSDPFMNKRTGVSYPFFKNDSTQVGTSDVTYGKYCVDLVSKEFQKHGVQGLRKMAEQYNVYTGYPRNQRGKGRALEAMSRINNIIVNMVNSSEMEALKSKSFGTGIKPVEGIRADLISIGEFCEKLGPDYAISNWDYSGYDQTVGAGFVNLSNAVRMMITNGYTGKEIIKIRHLCARKSWFINGPANRIYRIFGRTMSGYDDTTLQNTSINRLVSVAAAMSADREYSSKVYYPSHGQCVITLGDDLLIIYPKSKESEVRNYIESLGFKLHRDNKDARGVMFIQYRVFRKDGKYYMAYNWPRVLRSMLSKEDQKQLGECGWILSAYQQLWKLLEVPEFLSICFNIIAAFDPKRLMIDREVEEIIKGAEAEDKARLEKAKTANQKARVSSTAERLATNPQNKDEFVDENGKLKPNAFKLIQAELRKVNNPRFLEELGFKTPDLSKVH